MSKYKDTKFENSLELIPSALEWAEKQNVKRLSKFLLESANVPLYCFSSGGPSSADDYLALLYETNQGMAKSLTPLMMTSISDEALRNAKIVITAGSGTGEDEKHTVARAVKVNPNGVCGITRGNSKDNIIVKTLNGVTNNWFKYNSPMQKGFISSNSTIAMFGLFYKAFTKDEQFANKLDLDLSPNHCFTYGARIEGAIPQINEVRNFIVLYSGWSRPVAQDFEAKMVECGFASVQMCDYRNFCHGRFIFLSKHLEDSALVLFLSPREKDFAERLFNGKTYRGDNDVFPKNTAIITVETKFDSPLASIDLLIKTQVLFNEIAKAFGDEPCNPDNPHGIDKRYPRSLEWGQMGEMGALSSNIEGSRGTLKGINRRKLIKYDPQKSIEEIAKENGVQVPTILKYIRDMHIDRNRDEHLNHYNDVWKVYINDSDIPISELAKKVKMSENTVKYYLKKDANDFMPKMGKTGLVEEHPKVKELREEVQKLADRFELYKKISDSKPTLTAIEILKKAHWSEDKKGENLNMATHFMQMKEFKYKFKNKEIEYIHNEDANKQPSELHLPHKREKKVTKEIIKEDNIKGIIGAVIGEIVGSRFEFAKSLPKKRYELFANQCSFTDDTVLTVAIADALLHNKEFKDTLWTWGKRYPHAGFGKSFKEWLKRKKKDADATNDSKGNGCGMRVSPIGFYAKTLDEALKLAMESAIITHNSDEGVKGAQSIAAATFMAKLHTPKDEIMAYIEETFGYNLHLSDKEIANKVSKLGHGGERMLAEHTCPLAIIAFLVTDDFESAIRKAISYDCDTDTVACMAGGIAAAYYGVPQAIINEVTDYLPQEIIDIINEFDGVQLQNTKTTPKDCHRWGDIIVFGSGEDKNGETEAFIASKYFGANKVLEGMDKRAYAIPTVGRSLDEIKAAVDRFIEYAETHQDKVFLVTEIGCSKAGYTPKDIAPMFEKAKTMTNVYLPLVFKEVPETWERKTRAKKKKSKHEANFEIPKENLQSKEEILSIKSGVLLDEILKKG